MPSKSILIVITILPVMLCLAGCRPVASSAPTATSESSDDESATRVDAVPPCCNQGTRSAESAAESVAEDDNNTPQEPRVRIETIQGGVEIPDVSLVNQNDEPVQFYSDLVEGRIVVLNFLFTTCKGICPPMGANFAQLQQKIGDRFGDDVVLISVSVDPTIDTPQRLKAWRDRFGGEPGWNLLTGSKQEVDRLLKELEVFTADKTDHSPFILLGDERSGRWRRVHGLTAPEKLAELIGGLHEEAEAAAASQTPSPRDATNKTSESAETASSPARRWFTDVELVTQHGDRLRFYSDLLQDRVVVIQSFFSTCKGACPKMVSSFAKIQERFDDRLGRDLRLISISVDPETDTPEKLAVYAEQWNARPGWYFITGEKANVDMALHRIGHYTTNKESHSNVFIIGNESTGLWKKVRGLSEPEAIFPSIEEVLNDEL